MGVTIRQGKQLETDHDRNGLPTLDNIFADIHHIALKCPRKRIPRTSEISLSSFQGSSRRAFYFVRDRRYLTAAFL